MNLASSGGSFYEFAYEYRPLFVSDLNADLIVLAAHPAWLAGRRIKLNEPYRDPITVARMFRYGMTGQAWNAVSMWSWLAFHRNRLSLQYRAALMRLHEDAFLRLGRPLDALFPPAADPWRDERHYRGHADQTILKQQRDGWVRYGWFDEASFRRDSDETRALEEVLDALRGRASHVAIVLLPESSFLRERVPPAADRLFRAIVNAGVQPPPVIDMRRSLPDTLFYDYAHPNEDGRAVVSRVVIERLQSLGSFRTSQSACPSPGW